MFQDFLFIVNSHFYKYIFMYVLKKNISCPSHVKVLNVLLCTRWKVDQLLLATLMHVASYDC